MASQVNVNALTVVHAGSDGVAPSFPDVCLTPAPPGPPIPIPYPNVARSADTAQGTRSVIVEGNPIMVQEATFATSTGDEAGSAGGVASTTTKGKARFVNYSFDVKFEGKCVARLGDPMTHNELSAPNTPPFPEVQPPCPMLAAVVPDVPDDAQPSAAAAETYQVVWDKVNERQWVNLPSTWSDDCGRRVTLTAHIEPRVAGHKVRLAVIADPANGSRRMASLGKGSVRSGPDGGLTIVLELPIYGGDQFQVSAQAQGMSGAVLSPPITVWRRIFYQLTTMEPAPDGTRMDPPAGLMDEVQKVFSPVFIDLRPSTHATGTTPYLENAGGPEGEAAVAKAAIPDDRSPFKLHIVAVDHADRVAIVKEKHYESSLVESKPFQEWKHDPPWMEGLFETRKGLGDWQRLEDLEVVDRGEDQAVIHGRIPHPHPWSVLVRLQYLCQNGPSPAGWGGTSGRLYICVGFLRRKHLDAELVAKLSQTMCHEIGHALGLVPATASWRDTDPRDKKFTPKHCHHTKAGEPECVMWFKLSKDRPRPFCTSHEPRNCAHLLRAANLSRLKWV